MKAAQVILGHHSKLNDGANAIEKLQGQNVMSPPNLSTQTQQTHDSDNKPNDRTFFVIVLVGIALVSLVAGIVFGYIGFSVGNDAKHIADLSSLSKKVESLESDNHQLSDQLSDLNSELERRDTEYRRLLDKNGETNRKLSVALLEKENLAAQLKASPPTETKSNDQPETAKPDDSEAEIIATIKANAVKKWPDDYEMQNYERDNQIKAYRELSKLNSIPNVPDDVLKKIKSHAKSEWMDDYEMQLYTIQNKVEAYLDR